MILSLIITIIHYVADFIFQYTTWAASKSKNNTALFKHVLVYTVLWIPASFIIFSYIRPEVEHDIVLLMVSFFVSITFVAHYVTDYITSRITSKMFANGDYGTPIPNLGVFSVIGFDQILHYTQLFLSFYFISKLF